MAVQILKIKLADKLIRFLLAHVQTIHLVTVVAIHDRDIAHAYNAEHCSKRSMAFEGVLASYPEQCA